jgi:CubicO group peptidase (beta-lactamase class C family)
MLALISIAFLSFDATAQLSDAARGQIDAYLSEAVATTKIPGLVALVTDANGVMYEGAFGFQGVAESKPMSVDSIFRIASMTKPVTSAAVMMLVDQGKVRLDDPIERHLPALANRQVIETVREDGTYTARPAKQLMTVRHLMTHSSGLAYGFSNETLYKLTGGNFGASAQTLPLVHEPGERWTYGESTRVLGSLVEALSGESLDNYLESHMFAPLGMRDTAYTVPTQKIGRLATVHRMTDQGLVEEANAETVTSPDNGDGGLNSTAADYAAFIRMILNDGVAADGTRILSAESVEAMGQHHMGSVRVSLQRATMPMLSRDFPLGAGRDGFGLGFQVTGEHRDAGTRAPGSMSWAGIFNTEFWIDPANGIGGVLLMQYLPFYDEDAIATLQGFERRVYESLAPSP